MTISYTVWVQVERRDEDTDVFDNIELPDVLAGYSTEEAAREYVLGLLLSSPEGDAMTSDQVPQWFRTARPT